MENVTQNDNNQLSQNQTIEQLKEEIEKLKESNNYLCDLSFRQGKEIHELKKENNLFKKIIEKLAEK